MNEKYKKYKIWRFAYHSYVDNIIIPNDVKLYCINKDRSDDNGVYIDELNKTIWNETYIAVMPYSNELWELSNDKSQTCNLYQFNVNDEYIIWLFNQIYPLCDNFPETTEIPIVPISYICYRTERLNFYKNDYSEKLNQIKKMNLSSNDEETMIKNTFIPIYEYLKINGLDKEYKGYLDVTRIIIKSWVDESPCFNIKRESIDIKDVLTARLNEKIEKSSESEYNNIFYNIIKQII